MYGPERLQQTQETPKSQPSCHKLVTRRRAVIAGSLLAAYGGLKYFVPDAVLEDPCPETMSAQSQHFAETEDGDIFGRALLYTDNRCSTNARFFPVAGRPQVDIDGEIFRSSNIIPAHPALLRLLGLHADPTAFITGIHKLGDRIEFKLSVRNSSCSVPANVMTTLAHIAREQPNDAEVGFITEYKLHGPIAHIPGVSAEGDQWVKFQRVRPTIAAAQD